MLKFKCEGVSSRDARGHLVRCGVDWVEERAIAGLLLVMRFLFGWMALVFFVAEFTAGHGPIVFKFAMVSSMLTGMTWLASRKWGLVRRRIVFYRDGRVASPGGLPFFPKCRKWGVRLDQLSTFELSSRGGPEHAVTLYTTGGDTIIVARGLWQWQARKVTAQLNNKMRDMRDTRARPPSAGRVYPAAVRPKKEEMGTVSRTVPTVYRF